MSTKTRLAKLEAKTRPALAPLVVYTCPELAPRDYEPPTPEALAAHKAAGGTVIEIEYVDNWRGL